MRRTSFRQSCTTRENFLVSSIMFEIERNRYSYAWNTGMFSKFPGIFRIFPIICNSCFFSRFSRMILDWSFVNFLGRTPVDIFGKCSLVTTGKISGKTSQMVKPLRKSLEKLPVLKVQEIEAMECSRISRNNFWVFFL